jgi:D-3-phosphoglycerate dehydrogenase
VRVLLLDPLYDLAEAQAQLEGRGVRVERADEPEGDDVVALLVADTPIGAEELARLPNLRAVATASTGYDHLDVDALAQAGVWASNVGGYCDEEVAEHTIALTLNLLRGVAELDRSARGGAWTHEAAPPRRVAGAVLGVVGFGRIGRCVAHRGVALGMRVQAYDPVVPAAAIELAGVHPHERLHDLLRAADVVTLHVPLTRSTDGLIDAEALRTMRPGSFLVNCARAALVDHEALGRALADGHLAGAALDVLPVEPPSPDEPAMRWPRTIISPHAAWYSPDSAREPYRRAVADVAAALAGGEPIGALARPAAVDRR